MNERPRLHLRPVGTSSEIAERADRLVLHLRSTAPEPPVVPAEHEPHRSRRRMMRWVVAVALLDALVLAAGLVTAVSRSDDARVAAEASPVTAAPASPTHDDSSSSASGAEQSGPSPSRPSIAGTFAVQVTLTSFDQGPGGSATRPADRHRETWVLSGACDGVGACLLQDGTSAAVGGAGFALTPTGSGYDFRADSAFGQGDCAQITITRTIHIDIPESGAAPLAFSGAYASIAAPLQKGTCAAPSTAYSFATS